MMKEQLNNAIVKVLKKTIDSGNVVIKRGLLGNKFIVYAPDGKKMKKLFTIKRENGSFREDFGTIQGGHAMLHSLHKDHIEIDGKKYETIHSQGIYESVAELYKRQSENSAVAFLSQVSDKSRGK